MKQKSTFLLGTLLSLLISLPTNAQPEPQSVLQIRSGNLLPSEFTSAKKVVSNNILSVFKAKMPKTQEKSTMQTNHKRNTQHLLVNPKQCIWGNVVTDNLLGVYSFFPTQSIDFTELAPFKKGLLNGGCGIVDDELHCIYVDDTYAAYGVLGVTHYAFNTDTWELIEQSLQPKSWNVIATETAIDPKTGEVFGEFYSANLRSLEWGIIDYRTLTRTTIAKAEHSYIALGITNDGRAFGVADDGNLYQIDRTTGVETLKGSTGINVKDEAENHFYQTGEIDPNTNEFYWAAKTANGNCTLYTVDLNDGHVTAVGSMEKATVLGMVIPMPKAAAAAPNVATDLQTQFNGASTTGYISFKAPETQFDGTTLATNKPLSYTITANNKQVATGTVLPGQVAQTSIQVEEGMNHFIVVTTNEGGKSPKAKYEKYIGNDEPLPLDYVDLKIDDTRKATVSWDKPTQGLHQGYIGNLTYNVYRFSSTDTIKVASNLTATTFTETLPETTRTGYAYGVQAVNTTQCSKITVSEYKVTGNVFDTPYFDDFRNKNDALIYTIVDGNDDGFTWRWYDDEEKGRAFRYSYSRNNAGDDWLMSPPIKLKAGKTYKISFRASNAEEEYKERLEVKMGNAPTAQAMTTNVISPIELTDPQYHEFSAQVTPQSDGDYYIGFHAISDAKKSFIYLGEMGVEPIPTTNAPAAVENMNVIANPTGALKAAITFKAPTKAIDGNQLTAIKKIELRNGTKILKTFVAPTPGAELKLIDENPTQGINNYIAIAFNENGNGTSVTRRAYIGKDLPAEPVVKAIDQGSSVKLTWEPAKGAHGGVVEPSKVDYDIYDVNQNGLGNHIAIAKNGLTEYTVDGINTKTGAQRYRKWAIAANYNGLSSEFATASIILGVPYTLPYRNSFRNATFEQQLFQTTSSNDKVLWRLTSNESSDDDGGCLFFKPRAAGTSTITTGKIDMRGTTQPKLGFSYNAKAQTPVRLEITFEKMDGTVTDPVWIHDFASDTKVGKWTTEIIDLPETLTTQDYILMHIKAIAADASPNIVYLDNISISDPLQCDGAIELSAPTSVNKGQTVNLKVKVSNLGLDKIDHAAVKVSLNNKVIHQSDITKSLSLLQDFVIPISYATTILDPSEQHSIKAELTVANDMQTANNTDLANIILEKANVLPPTNLTSKTDKVGMVELLWNKPETTKETIRENFESYEAWQTNFGKWTTFDADKGYAIPLSAQVSYPHQGEQFAFINWKPDDYFRGTKDIAPHSGRKAAVAMYQQNAEGNVIGADNWLISQPLSEEEQTISFWVNNAQGNSQTTEIFEVLASSTDNKPASFSKIDAYKQESAVWNEITTQLPSGTRYFAIRHTTPASQGLVFMIDDITFDASNGPAAYNIYRNDSLIVSTTSPSFTDDKLKPGTTHSYKVTAVYPDGSESEPISVTATTNIHDIVGNVNLSYDVYTVDGKLVAKGLHNLNTLQKGMYIINGKTIIIQ